MNASAEVPQVAPDATLGTIVAARPQTAALFEELGLDYCCGGGQTLEQACEGRDLDPVTVRKMLAASEVEATAPKAEHDLRGLPVDELVDHIVEGHHRPLRSQLERIAELLDKVVSAHGYADPEVKRLRQRYTEFRSELIEHMSVEEGQLFPACRALADDGGYELDADLFGALADDHAATGAALAELRELGNDYRPESAHCTTHRVLLSELGSLEADLHLHVHEENNILFPEARRLLQRA